MLRERIQKSKFELLVMFSNLSVTKTTSWKVSEWTSVVRLSLSQFGFVRPVLENMCERVYKWMMRVHEPRGPQSPV